MLAGFEVVANLFDDLATSIADKTRYDFEGDALAEAYSGVRYPYSQPPSPSPYQICGPGSLLRVRRARGFVAGASGSQVDFPTGGDAGL